MKVYLIFILCSVSICLYSQDEAFVINDKGTSTISFDTVIHDSAILEPFPSGISISSLVFSGEITLHSKSSLVRIILVDIHHHEYLIHETYPLLAGSSEIYIEKAGEETSFLNNIIPSSIKVDIIDASIHLHEIVFSEDDVYLKMAVADVLKSQSQSKIDRINMHIREAGFKWVAGETSISRLTYQEKKSMFGGSIPNLQGFEYYIGGVYVLPGITSENLASMNLKSANTAHADSQFVSEFSWRDRHGEDWTTPVKDQGECNSCWAFASTAATELLINLYYNQHLDYDLSEQNLISCITGSCSQGATYMDALNYIRDTGVVLENCFAYSASELPCTDVCNNPVERIQIGSYTTYNSIENKKKAIIRGAAGFNIIEWNHMVQAIGFKTIKEDDSLFVRNVGSQTWITFEEDHPLIGSTTWLCKNSWSEEWGDSGYVYIIGNFINQPIFYLHEPISSSLLDESDIICIDQDGDGYYSWGIGPKPSHCPDCPDHPDGDDSDPCTGPMDEFGYLTSISVNPFAEDIAVLYCNVIPDLYAAGTNIQWYSDEELSNLVHSGNFFPTGHTDTGDYTYFVTQTSAVCGESEATEVTLSILIPRPRGQDTVIAVGEPAVLSVTGVSNNVYSWYADPSLDTLLGQGVTYNTGLTSPGTYVFYVTQTICSVESEPDTVMMTIWRNDEIRYSDTSFINALIDKGVDTNDDGWISYGEAAATISINVSGKGICDLTGIEYFTNLDTLISSDNHLTKLDLSDFPELIYLDCGSNLITNLDLSDFTSLAYLDCSRNPFTSLDVTNNSALTVLICIYNQINTLDVSNNLSLTYLDCSFNQLTSLDVSNNIALSYLDCRYNEINSLDVLSNITLAYLECGGNKIADLDISKNEALKDLGCDWNRLTSLDVSNNGELVNLNCDRNKLDKLDVTNNISLENLNCGRNFISDLDVSNNIALSVLNCGANQLTSLLLSPCTNLTELSCGGNPLSRLDISNNNGLTSLECVNNGLTSLDVSKNSVLRDLWCVGNHLTSLDVSQNIALRTLFCGGNQLTDLDISNNTAIKDLNCSNNQLANLFLCANDSIEHLFISGMPSLETVYVWETPFPPAGVYMATNGSPNVVFIHCTSGTRGVKRQMISIYPNPVNDLLTIETDTPGLHTIEISYLNGHPLYNGILEGSSHQIDLSSLKNGLYLITVRSRDLVITDKIVKVK
jgi:Leucine-rich repeat (LRR) protein/C1A family cysteine protease